MSKVNPTARGARFERSVKAMLVEKGFEVMRAAASKGKFDLIATNETGCYHIQCKSNRPNKPTAQLVMLRCCLPRSCIAVLVWRSPRGELVFYTLAAPTL